MYVCASSLSSGRRKEVQSCSRLVVRGFVFSWGRGVVGGGAATCGQGRKGAEGEEKKRFADQMRDSVEGFQVVSPLWETEDF